MRQTSKTPMTIRVFDERNLLHANCYEYRDSGAC